MMNKDLHEATTFWLFFVFEHQVGLGRGQAARPGGSDAAQPSEGEKVGSLFVVLSGFQIHQPSGSLGDAKKL